MLNYISLSFIIHVMSMFTFISYPCLNHSENWPLLQIPFYVIHFFITFYNPKHTALQGTNILVILHKQWRIRLTRNIKEYNYNLCTRLLAFLLCTGVLSRCCVYYPYISLYNMLCHDIITFCLFHYVRPTAHVEFQNYYIYPIPFYRIM